MERPGLCVERPLECGLYGYANNNPIKFADDNGEKVYTPNATPQFRAYVQKIASGMGKYSPKGALRTLVKSKTIHVKVVEITDQSKKQSPRFVPKTNTIDIRKNQGLKRNGKILSSAAILEHEAGHKLEGALRPSLKAKEKIDKV